MRMRGAKLGGWTGSEIAEKGEEVETLALLYTRRCRVEVRGRIQAKMKFARSLGTSNRMIPSFTSFPSQPPQPVSEVSSSSPRHRSSEKVRNRSGERSRDDDKSERRRHRQKHKHKRRDRDYDFKEDERREASSSSTAFFSDHKGNRAAAHGGGTDSIRVPRYHLVARTSLPNVVKCD